MGHTIESDEAIAAAQGFTRENAPLHSLWKLPGDEVGRTVAVTEPDGSMTWRINIHDDAVALAVAAFLERHGAPAFARPSERDAYATALEAQLRAGLHPVQARDAALRAVGGLIEANLRGGAPPLPPCPPLTREGH